MPEQKLEELVPELKDQLLDGAQQIFVVAFTSAQEDGMSREAALDVAWNTVRQDYEQGDDGKWHRKPDDNNVQRAAVQSGGN